MLVQTALFLLAAGATAAPLDSGSSNTIRGIDVPVHQFTTRRSNSVLEKRSPGDIVPVADDYDVSFVIDVDVGTPAQKASMLLKKQGMTFVKSSACTDCMGSNKIDAGASSSWKPMQPITYNSPRSTRVLTGTLGQDVVGIAGYSAPYILSIEESGNYSSNLPEELSGAINLEFAPPYGLNIYNTFKTSWPTPYLGMYMGRDSTPKADRVVPYDTLKPNAGVFTFGGTNPDLYTGDIKWQPTSSSYFGATVVSIQVGGTQVSGSMLTTFHVGYTAMELPAPACAAVHAAIPGAEQAAGTTYWRMPCDTNTSVTFTMADVPITLQPEDIIARGIQDAPSMCSSSIVCSNDAQAVLGVPALRNVYVAYDYETGAVAFAPLAADLDSKVAAARAAGTSIASTATAAATRGAANGPTASLRPDGISGAQPVAQSVKPSGSGSRALRVQVASAAVGVAIPVAMAIVG